MNGLLEETELDLEEVDLRGWETHVSDLLVASYIKGIEMGDVFPNVPVVRVSQNCYDLYRGSLSRNNFGGHHRAVAHLIAKVRLRCQVIPEHDPSWQESGVRISIKKVLLYKDTEERMRERR